MAGVIGNEGALRRRGIADEVQKLRCRIAFYVQFDIEHCFQIVDVLVADMAGVGPGMNRDAVCAVFHGRLGRLCDARQVGAAAVAQECDFVDVYAKVGDGTISMLLILIAISQACSGTAISPALLRFPSATRASHPRHPEGTQC